MPDLGELVEVLPLKMDRDYEEIDRLFEEEEWPFVRADLEVSHAQPRAVAMVARHESQVMGFFAAHHFGDVGYLDMMIVDARARQSSVAHKLYFETMRRMRKNGLRSFVAHSTNDSYRMFSYLRFQTGQSFTLLRREPLASERKDQAKNVIALSHDDFEDIVALDEQVFGVRRPEWIGALLKQPTTSFYGLRSGDRLKASVCIRPRKLGAICLDAINSLDFSDAALLLNDIIGAYADRRLECFVRDDSPLYHHFIKCGFEVPDFFAPIGPLVEWRKGEVGEMGLSANVQSLSWF